MNGKFVVDGMLGSLARKLRIFGYDTVYDVKIGDEEILKTAQKEGRTVLTSDRMLFQAASKKKVECILLTEDSDEDRLVTVFKDIWSEAKRLNPQVARCAVCNGAVVKVDKAEVANVVPEGVLKTQEEFFRCGSCSKVYWIGGHWRRLYELSESVNRRLQQA